MPSRVVGPTHNSAGGFEEDGGSIGTVCIYQASSPEAIREHARRADLPVDEIIAVVDTVLVRPDPVAPTA